MKNIRQLDWFLIGLWVLALFALISLIWGCDKILDTDEEDDMDVRIHISGFGGSSSGSSWQRGYVTNHSGPKIVRVKVQWSTSNDSGSSSCFPSVLGKGDEGKYYISYIGSGLQTSVSYDKE